jgi:UDP-glucose 4-epimerase
MRPDLRSANILVVGGAGFIGSHLVDKLKALSTATTVIVDNLFLGSIENIKATLQAGALFYEVDAEDYLALEGIIENHSINVVFNLATKALNYSFIQPREAFETNTKVIGNLLELQRLGKYQTLCHFSSSEVYGSVRYEPMDEEHPINPTTTYAGGKAAADIMLRTYVNMFEIDAFILRPFNNYGPRQNCLPPLAGIIPQTIARIKNNDCPIIEGSGEQRRDFIYVEDTVDASLSLYNLIEPGHVVNISADQSISIKDLVNMICQITGYTGPILYHPARNADVLYHSASNELMLSLISFQPITLVEGLQKTVDWYWSILL